VNFRQKKEEFYLSKILFISAGCKPEIGKDAYGKQSMEVRTGKISNFPYDLAKNLPEMNEWGTSVDRALVFALAYESDLSDLTWGFANYPEIKKYRTKYNSYLSLADSIAKKLCYKNQPTDAQLKFSETAISRLQNEWEGFSTWESDVNFLLKNTQDENSAEVQEYLNSLVPKCDEIKTNNPNYNIVKCTNIP
jgi:hypothetical protein